MSDRLMTVMMSDRLMTVIKLISFRDWLPVIEGGGLAFLMLARIAGNIREIFYVRGLWESQGRYYSFRRWRARPAAVLLILIVESMAVLIIGALTVTVLAGGALDYDWYAGWRE
ncbi:Uncharacterized protein EbC_pEb17200230 (plasmid) [Erwinia billingiae Eb661]|uniref:Uncharacterized protein n=1 Tax=Erwinia billingiae (strain Eb661) TaxID=634500 RepID=D8MJM8_ERWBE|nr:hypothetical protein [Erwinia billingiae]CAX53476.1 Uncharacterized protein EbC_pEb17200230 [Erwinia billingiae Eb661]